MGLPQNIRFDNLLSSVKGYLTPDVVQSTSSLVGESESATQAAMNSGVSSLFAGLANLASTPDGASTLGNLSREPAFGTILNNISSVFSGGSATSSMMSAGQGLLAKIFGGRSSQVADLVARSSGVSQSSAGKIMSILAPLVTGVLGRQVVARGLSNTGLANMLLEQKDEIEAAAPAGLRQILGAGKGPIPVPPRVSPGGAEARVPQRARTEIMAPERPAAGSRWLTLLLMGVAVLGLLWFFSGRARRVGERTVQTTKSVLASITLPGGVNISVQEGSINYNLARFLADNNQTAPKTFVFDNLNFETGTTQLTAASGPTVTNLAQILKAYPNSQVQLIGHTDNTGTAEANQKLSLDRADTVKQILVNDGVAGDRIATAGYGQDRPISSNDTEEGRAKNRRIELLVTKK